MKQGKGGLPYFAKAFGEMKGVFRSSGWNMKKLPFLFLATRPYQYSISMEIDSLIFDL